MEDNPFIFITLFVIILIIISILKFKFRPSLSAADVKGISGEMKVDSMLKKEKVKYFTDVLLQLGNTSTQIDHLVIFPNKTILVIETKNRDGKFYGNETDQNWTQVFPNKKYKLYNPVIQNQGHIRFLERYCVTNKLRGYHFINLVVFTGDRTELTSVPSNTITHHQLPRIIKLYKKKKTLLNQSTAFARNIALNDQSNNKKKVNQHLSFIKKAKKHKRKKF